MSDAPTRTLRALIVDDERQARVSVRAALRELPDVNVVGECRGGREAVAAIERDAPDIVFLDVVMPEIDGLDVIAAVGVERMPATIFITAHDIGAMQAFDAAAVDYVMKPFEPARVHAAVDRVRERMRLGEAATDAARLRMVVAGMACARPPATRVLVPTEEGVMFVPVETVDWIEADGKHVRLHTAAGTHRIRATLQGVQERLDPRAFVRVHRSSVLRVDSIREVRRWFGGDHIAVLGTGQEVKVSRTYAPDLLRMLS